MKKNLLYLFALVCSLSLFVACSDDDDDDDKKEPWKELSKTYQGDKLKINEVKAAAGATVEVNAVSEETATLKLNNIVPEDKTVTIEAKLTKAGTSYNITGDNTVNDCKISVNGSFTDGVLNLSVGRDLTTAVTGNLLLAASETGFPIHWVAVTGNEAIDAQLAAVGPMIGGLMATKVTAVNVKLPANGTFDVNWTTVAGETAGMSDMVKQMVKIQYAVLDNKFYMVLDKVSLPLLEMVPGLLGLELNIDELLAIFTDLGGFYGLPLEFTQDGSTFTFKANKQQVITIMSLIAPIILPNVPDQMKPMFEMLMQALPNAQQLELGLPFTKQ